MATQDVNFKIKSGLITGTGTAYDTIVYPTTDGTNGQVLTTDGSGNLSFEDSTKLVVLSTKTIDNPNSYGTSTSDEFGYAVAVSGNYTVVGAPKEDELLGGIPYDNTGRVYIFDTDSGSLLHTLQDTVSDQNANFGTSVDVSGKYAIVGAPGTDGGEGSESGRAYIFDVTTGTLVYTLNNPNAYNTATLDRFGDSVSISGKYVIVGAPGEDDAAGLNSGKAYIFDVEAQVLLYTLDNPNQYGTSQSDQFAHSVSISGNHVIVGAPGERGISEGTTNSGQAYIYDISTFPDAYSTITSATYRLPNPSAFGDGVNDIFSTSVSISGNYAIVGAPDEDDANGNSSGKAYLYDISTFTSSLVLSATHVLDNPNVYGTSTNDQYGSSVAISGNYAIVGAVGEDESSGSDSGKVYLYDISTFTTTTISSANYVLDNPNAYSTPTTDNFGSSVAISGNRVVAGTYNEDDANGTTSGKAYIFRTNGPQYSYNASEIALLSGGIELTDLSVTQNTASGNGTLAYNNTNGVFTYTPPDLSTYLTSVAFSDLTSTPTTLAGYGITDAFDGAYSSLTGAPTNVSSFTNDAGYLTSETTTTLTSDSVNQKLVFTDETGTPNDVDLSWAVDDTNLARITSGSVDGGTGVATFTRDDATTFTVDFSALFDDTNLTRITSGSVSGSTLTLTRSDATTVDVDVSSLLDNTDTIDYINAASFNSETGVLSLTGVGNAGATVDLDGRYLTSVAFSDLTSTPTTIAGYGITDAFDGAYSSLTGAPTNVSTFTNDSGYLVNIVEDTTPQLGGDLDTNDNDIIFKYSGSEVSRIETLGTGDVESKWSSEAGTTIRLDAGSGSATAGSNLYLVGGNFLSITGTDVFIQNLLFPRSDGTNGQVLTTDGIGNLSFADTFDGAFSSLSGTPTTIAGYGITDAFDGAYSSLTGAPTNVSSFTNDAGYLTAETTTTLTSDSVNQKLVFTDETGTPNDVDLSWAVDDTNLARLTSGSVDGGTGVATFTRDDATTFTVDFSALFDDTNLTRITSGSVSGSTLTLTRSDATTVDVDVSSLLDNTDTIDYINAASFNTSDGVLTLTGVGNAGATVDLDGRYLTSVAFADLTTTPTTIAGYGITDAFDGAFSSLSGTPTTIAGYGITDAFDGAFSSLSGTPTTISGYGITDAFDGAYSSLTGAPTNVSSFTNDAGYLTAETTTTLTADIPDRKLVFTDETGTPNDVDLSWIDDLKVLSTKTLDNPNAYDTSAADFFGKSVAISGNYAIVSAHSEDDAGGSNSGKAYIFNTETGSLLHTLDNPNAYDTSAGDLFGISVAISGNYAIVGANGEDEAGSVNPGKAYIFNVTDGSLVHTLDNPNAFGTSEFDGFGNSVAISGNYAIVSAIGEDDAGGDSSGKAYIFNVTTGTLVHTLDNPNAYDTASFDSFGKSVAISGNYAIVGAWDEDDAGGTSSGKAYIFDVTSGSLLYTLDNPNAYGTSASDLFGTSVAISGNYVIVGAYQEDDAGGTGSGKAYIYDISTFTTSTISSANYVLDNPNAFGTSQGDLFGISVAISGNYAIVGAGEEVGFFGEDDAGGTSSGKAYIYDISTFTTGTISSANYVLDNPNAFGTSQGDGFGSLVAISGNYVIVGAILEDDAGGGSSGKAYIFRTNAQPYSYIGDEIASFAGYTLPTASDTVLGGVKVGAGLAIDGSGILSATQGGTADSVEWTGVLNTPTTIAGYGITDAFDGAFSSLSGTPTTIAGYGITDAFDGAFSSLSGTPTTIAGYGITDAFDGAYSSLTGAPTNVSTFTNDAGYLTSETTTTLTSDSVNQKLVFTDETGTPNDVDLSWAVDDTNLARITSGSVNGSTGIATFTRDDATTFTVDFSALFDDTNLTRITSGSVSGSTLTLTRSDATTVSVDVSSLLDNTDTIDYINGATFNTADGVLTLTGVGNAGATVDLDGRYLTSVAFADLTTTPTTIAGYGITDAFDGAFSSLSGTPTTIAGYGITDAFDGAYSSLTGAPTTVSSFTNDSGYIANVVEDTTPQLGGDLQNNSNNISITNGNLFMQAGANSGVIYGASVYLGNALGTAGLLRITGDGAGTDGSLTVFGDVTLNDIVYPSVDGTNGQVLTTDGAGNLSFATVSSGGIALTDLSVTQNTASGNGTLAYNNTNGVFTYTPPDLSPYLTSVAFSDLTSTPTTIAGYGITDAFDGAFSSLSGTPTTIAGYGITDAFDGAYSSLTGAPTNVSSFTNDSGYITGYTVTEGDVTAHEAALSITKSQVTDLATSDLDLGTNKILYSNVYSNLVDLPTASSYHGMFAHVHGTGKAYYAHAGSWVELANVSELFDGAYSSLTGAPTNVSSFTNDAGYLTSETTTTLTADSVNQKLVFTDETGTPNDVDLSWAVDDTNLARLTSGTVDANTGIATFTRDDATDFTVDFSALFDDTNLTRITSGSVSGNDLTLTRSDATTVVVDVTSLNGLSNVVEDTTPQLGGDLDANFKNIINVDTIEFDSAGTSVLSSLTVSEMNFSGTTIGGTTPQTNLKGWSINHQGVDDNNKDIAIRAYGGSGVNPRMFLQCFGSTDGTGEIWLASRGTVDIEAYGDISITPSNNGSVIIDGLTYPSVDGTNGQALTTDGSGNLSFADVSVETDRYAYEDTKTFVVTVDTKDSTHPQFNNGSANGYKIDGAFAPFLHMVPGMTYRFDQSDASNSGHPVVFYYDENKTTSYTDGVTNNGTPGSAGAYTQIIVTDTTPSTLYYQCSAHALMGWGLNVSSHNNTGLTTDTLDEGSTNLYYTDSRVNTYINNNIDTDDVSEGATNLYFNQTRARQSISADVSSTITYNNTTGVISIDDSSYLTSETYSTASELLTAIKTVDGASSGLEADLLDGQEGSYYLNYSNLSNTPTSILNFGITDGTAGQVLQTDGSGNFSFTTVSGGGGGGVGYAGYEDYFFNVSSQTSSFGTSADAHDKVQVFVNGAYLDDSDFTFNATTGIVTLTTAAENGDEVSIWAFNSTGLSNHELFTVDGSGNIEAPGTIQIGNHRKEGSLTSTIASTSPTNVVMYASADYVGSKLIVTVTDTVTGDTQITEALILTVNGGTPKITTYGTMYTSANALASFDVANVSTNTALEVTMASSNSSTVKVAYTLIDA